MPLDQMPDRPGVAPSAVQTLRELASTGRLAAIRRDEPQFVAVRAAVYDMVWPLVWARHTRRVEEGKGHFACASSVGRMPSACLDAFHDDVEAVVDYVFGYAKQRIRNLEGWIASRIAVATVDGHRRRRGTRGALQRIRVPRWLGRELGDDTWLVELAARIIEWAGVPATAGFQTWPLNAWSELRAGVTGDQAGSRPPTVACEVDQVLAAMARTRPGWIACYIERPMGRKQFPVGIGNDNARQSGEPSEAELVRGERDDAFLVRLAAAATDAISMGLAEGRDPAELVPRVIGATFLRSAPADLERAPSDGSADRDDWLSSVLADHRTVARLVNDVLVVIELGDVD